MKEERDEIYPDRLCDLRLLSCGGGGDCCAEGRVRSMRQADFRRGKIAYDECGCDHHRRKITAVGTGLSAPAGSEQVDLSNFTVLPGLIDAHIHIWSGPRESNSSEGLEALRAQKAMNYALESGIAAVRVLGTSDFLDVALRDAIDEGTIPGPHMIPAGPALSIPRGHG